MDRAKLKQQAAEGLALRELKTHAGWRELVAIIQALYTDAFEHLEEKEDPEARATLHALRSIMDILDDRVRLGAAALKELSPAAATPDEGTA